MKRKKKDDSHLAVTCEHANEVPVVCPCDDDCYCKSHSCSGTKSVAASSGANYIPAVPSFIGDFFERCAIAALPVAARRLPTHADVAVIAGKAFEIADAMVEEREKRARAAK